MRSIATCWASIVARPGWRCGPVGGTSVASAIMLAYDLGYAAGALAALDLDRDLVGDAKCIERHVRGFQDADAEARAGWHRRQIADCFDRQLRQ